MTLTTPSQDSQRINRLNEKGLMTFTGSSHVCSYKRPLPVRRDMNVMYVTNDHFQEVKGGTFSGIMYQYIGKGIDSIHTAYSLPPSWEDVIVLWTNIGILNDFKLPTNNCHKIPIVSRKFTFNESTLSPGVIFKFVKRTKELEKVIAMTLLKQ